MITSWTVDTWPLHQDLRGRHGPLPGFGAGSGRGGGHSVSIACLTLGLAVAAHVGLGPQNRVLSPPGLEYIRGISSNSSSSYFLFSPSSSQLEVV